MKPSRRKQIESIQLKVDVKVGAIEIGFATDKRPLSMVQLQGATTKLVIKSSYTQVDCAIGAINVEDLNPQSIHKQVIEYSIIGISLSAKRLMADPKSANFGIVGCFFLSSVDISMEQFELFFVRCHA